MIMLTLHNLHFYHDLMLAIRKAILENRFSKFQENFLKNYNKQS